MKNRKMFSYVKKPFAKKSIEALCIMVFSLSLLIASIVLSVKAGGKGGPNVGALAFSGFLFSFVALKSAFAAFTEKEKKYTLAKITMGLFAAEFLIMVVLVIIGLLA